MGHKISANSLKLYVWYRAQGYSWEQMTVLATSLIEAKKLARQEGCDEKLLKTTPTIYDKPVAIFDCH